MTINKKNRLVRAKKRDKGNHINLKKEKFKKEVGLRKESSAKRTFQKISEKIKKVQARDGSNPSPELKRLKKIFKNFKKENIFIFR